MAVSNACCSAFNCGNKYGNEGITFHRFPVEKPKILVQWLSVISKPKWEPTRNHFICNEHFTNEDFIEKSGYRFLKYDAVPSKFHVLPRPKTMFPKEWPYRFFVVKDVETENYKGYVVEAKIALDTEDQFRIWLKAHEELSKIPYKLTQKYAKINKNLSFKAEFGCRHGAAKCPAKLLVKIRTIDPKIPRLKDTDPLSYPCTVVFCHLHNHRVASSKLLDVENVTSEDVSDEVKLKFTEMYKGMYSQELAFKTHQTDLQEEYVENYEEISRDKHFCPDMDWVTKLYEDLAKAFGEITQESMISALANEVKQINGEKGKAKFHKIEEHVVVALCTPLMERAHSLKSSGEIVFLDGSGFLERSKCYVYVLMAYSCTEGLPLGVLLTTSDSESILVSGFQLLADLLPERAFGQYGVLGPEAFLIDNNEGIQNSIKAVFPESTVLLCSFTMLKTMWRWLWNEDNKVEAEDRCHLFSMVHAMMKPISAEEFNEAHQKILQSEIAKKYPEYLAYCKEICDLSERWAVCFKNQIIDKDKDVSSLDIASHVLKDKIHLTKAYNMSQLFRFLANDLESYYERKIIHCINNTLEKFIQFSYKQEMRTIDDLEAEKLPSGQCKVTHKKSGNTYFADMNLWVCSCELGQNGSRCKHQYAVCTSKILDLSSTVPADEVIKKELHWIATNSVNSLFGNMEPGSGDSDAGMEAADDEYDPRQSQKKTMKPKAVKKPTTPKEEAKVILDRVVKDILQRYDRNPIGYHKAIVALAVGYQSLFTDDAIMNAISNLGKRQ